MNIRKKIHNLQESVSDFASYDTLLHVRAHTCHIKWKHTLAHYILFHQNFIKFKTSFKRSYVTATQKCQQKQINCKLGIIKLLLPFVNLFTDCSFLACNLLSKCLAFQVVQGGTKAMQNSFTQSNSDIFQLKNTKNLPNPKTES